ncbi:hypothetical protein MLD38_000810 [Melastoma candidum]|uniref:Uncharacterized protein n=1 Tax=Melastoma candidum TaxID=119954 RepID=A0ACB9SCI4_9MYRT|nr:hypothetical protein MLD38_000810 [Melastoma candidum]
MSVDFDSTNIISMLHVIPSWFSPPYVHAHQREKDGGAEPIQGHTEGDEVLPLRENARKEFEKARFNKDPEVVTQLLIGERDTVDSPHERLAENQRIEIEEQHSNTAWDLFCTVIATDPN